MLAEDHHLCAGLVVDLQGLALDGAEQELGLPELLLLFGCEAENELVTGSVGVAPNDPGVLSFWINACRGKPLGGGGTVNVNDENAVVTGVNADRYDTIRIHCGQIGGGESGVSLPALQAVASEWINRRFALRCPGTDRQQDQTMTVEGRKSQAPIRGGSGVRGWLQSGAMVATIQGNASLRGSTMPPRKGAVRLQVFIEPEERQALRVIAESESRTLSGQVAHWIRDAKQSKARTERLACALPMQQGGLDEAD